MKTDNVTSTPSEGTMAAPTERSFGIYKAIAQVQQECPPLVKGETANAKKFSYDYISLPKVLEILTPLLEEVGLGYHWYTQATTESTLLCVAIYLLDHPHTERVQSSIMVDMSGTFQQVGSQLTYYQRYLLLLTLGLVAVPDDDGNGGYDGGDDDDDERGSGRGRERRNSRRKSESSSRGRSQRRRSDEDEYDDDEYDDEEEEPRTSRRQTSSTKSYRRTR